MFQKKPTAKTAKSHININSLCRGGGVVANKLDCNIGVSEFEFQSRYSVYIRIIYSGKVWIPYHTIVLLRNGFWRDIYPTSNQVRFDMKSFYSVCVCVGGTHESRLMRDHYKKMISLAFSFWGDSAVPSRYCLGERHHGNKRIILRLISRHECQVVPRESIKLALSNPWRYMLRSFSVDEIFLPRHVNCSSNFMGLPLEVDMVLSNLKLMNSVSFTFM